ncbi:MAG: 3-dehydroquinate synthase [Candidatus Omnitrophota bacterium]
MKTINVNLGARSYPIYIGTGILRQAGRLLAGRRIGSDAYIITNSTISRRYGALLSAALRASGISVRVKRIGDTEKSKSLSTAAAVLEDLARFDRKKSVFIVALGGGVVGDLAGFVAAIYKRGVPYIQVPTTLLAQVDSSIGGKTAVDLPDGKNLVGAFYQPMAVIVDCDLLKSLDVRQLRQGMAEAIKYGLIRDRQLFGYIERNIIRILSGDPEVLLYIVRRCASIKADIVSRDEREERSLRTILNFGHTIGHAIEAAGGYSAYGHGEAVSLGMLAAAYISGQMKLLDTCSLERIKRIILSAGLPAQLRKVSIRKIIFAHYRDKKFIAGRNRFVLLNGIGKAIVAENVSSALIRRSVEQISAGS